MDNKDEKKQASNTVKSSGKRVLGMKFLGKDPAAWKALSVSVKDKDFQTKQVIILGSGFDTRAVRKSTYTKNYGVKFFEIDFPVVLNEKAEIYKKHGIDPNATYIKIDYIKEDLIENLKNNKVDFTAPTHFIWEGNIGYLAPEDTLKTLISIKDNFKNFRISLTFVDLVALQDIMKQKFNVAKSITSIKPLANEHNLVVLDEKSISDLQVHYDIDENPRETMKHFKNATLANSGCRS